MGKITEILKLRRETRILDRLNDELCVKLEALEDEAKELRTRNDKLLELRRALGGDYEPEHLEVMATIFPPADSLVGYTLKIATPSEGEESWSKSDRSWLLATTPSSKRALIRTPIHKPIELKYCMQVFTGLWRETSGEDADMRDFKKLSTFVKIGDTKYQVIQAREYTEGEPDGDEQLWLGHWNDGVEDA